MVTRVGVALFQNLFIPLMPANRRLFAFWDFVRGPRHPLPARAVAVCPALLVLPLRDKGMSGTPAIPDSEKESLGFTFHGLTMRTSRR